jgi:hypothetical protein
MRTGASGGSRLSQGGFLTLLLFMTNVLSLVMLLAECQISSALSDRQRY